MSDTESGSASSKDSTKIILSLVVALIVFYGGYRIYKSFSMGEEDKIKKVLYAIQEEASEGNSRGIVGYLTDDFQDANNIDKSQFRYYMSGYFLKHKGVNIHFHQIDVKLSPAKTKAKVYVEISRVSGTFNKNSRPEIKCEMRFIKNDKGQWRIKYISYDGLDISIN